MAQNKSSLIEFVEASKSKGSSDEFLATLLTRRGWPPEDVYSALATYWERATGISVPARASGGESSRDAFLYLLSFLTLATWACGLGSMLFHFIEHWLPDPVSHQYLYNLRGAITWQMATVAVAFPIFFLVTRTILREAETHPERLQSPVRKWLTYIALLLTAGGLIGDLICIFDFFLTGELSSRFILKALTVLVICGAIFLYYLGSLRWNRDTNVRQAAKRSFGFGVAAAAVVVVTFCVGLSVAGTPSQQRHIEADLKRVLDLQQISNAIYTTHRRAEAAGLSASLPTHLSDLAPKELRAAQIVDPETRKSYEYRVLANERYELCATFAEANDPDQTRSWHHGAGRTCFPFNAAQPSGW